MKTLPAGTVIKVATPRAAQELHGLFILETLDREDEPRANEVTLAEPLRLVTQSYLEERDNTEMELYRRIGELQEEIKKLRFSK